MKAPSDGGRIKGQRRVWPAGSRLPTISCTSPLSRHVLAGRLGTGPRSPPFESRGQVADPEKNDKCNDNSTQPCTSRSKRTRPSSAGKPTAIARGALRASTPWLWGDIKARRVPTPTAVLTVCSKLFSGLTLRAKSQEAVAGLHESALQRDSNRVLRKVLTGSR